VVHLPPATRRSSPRRAPAEVRSVFAAERTARAPPDTRPRRQPPRRCRPIRSRCWRGPGRSPSLRRVRSSAPAASSSSCCRPTPSARRARAEARRSAPAARRASARARRGFARGRPSGRGASPSAATSRRDEPRRDRDLADEAVAPLRPRKQRVEQRGERARSVSSFPTASGNSSASKSSAGGRRPLIFAVAPPPPGPRRAGRPAQAFGHGCAREPGKLSQTADAECLELGVALFVRAGAARAAAARGSRAVARPRRRSPGPGRANRRGRERREAPLGCAGPRIPGRPTAASARCSAASSPP